MSNCRQNGLGVPLGVDHNTVSFIIYINDLPSQLMKAFVTCFYEKLGMYMKQTLTPWPIDVGRCTEWNWYVAPTE